MQQLTLAQQTVLNFINNDEVKSFRFTTSKYKNLMHELATHVKASVNWKHVGNRQFTCNCQGTPVSVKWTNLTLTIAKQ